METSAPKRRKLSPNQSVAVSKNNNNNHDGNPGDEQTTAITPPDPQPTAPSKAADRPSFASPTRASLARHNPDVLGRMQSSGAKLRRKSPARPNNGASRQPQVQDEAAASMETRPQRDLDLDTSPRDASLGPNAPGGGLSAKPRRSPVRALAQAQESEMSNPFQGRTLRRSYPRPDQADPELPEPEVPEPELPQPLDPPDPVLSTPPSGIHNTPSQRPRRSRALAERIKSSSPLKPKPPPKLFDSQHPLSWELPSNAKAHNGKQVVAPSQNEASAPASDQREDRARRRAMRGIEDSLGEAEKKRKRDELLAEVAQLEADVAVLMQTGDKVQRGRTDLDATMRNAAADVLRRHLLRKEEGISSEVGVSSSDAQWLEMAMNPMSFLPFGTTNLSQLPSLFAPESQDRDEQPIPLSHHPIPMTAEEELPFLQVFTPLSFTSTISIPPRQSATAPILQQHTIIATSATPPGLFTAHISMAVDAATQRIHALSVPRLDPAAASELAPMIAATTASAARGRQNNICVLAWAMGEWVRVATRRARFWRVLESELGTKEAMAAAVSMARSRRNKRQRQSGRDDGDNDAGDDNGDEVLGEGSELPSRAELLPYMGRTAMELNVPVAADDDGDGVFCLRIRWRIRFDWTGEAESEVEVVTGVPGKWRKSDERGKLYGIPDLFGKMVEGDGDPVTAVRTVVALLAGDNT